MTRVRLTDYLCLAANDNWYPAGALHYRVIGRALGVTSQRARQLVGEALDSVRAVLDTRASRVHRGRENRSRGLTFTPRV